MVLLLGFAIWGLGFGVCVRACFGLENSDLGLG